MDRLQTKTYRPGPYAEFYVYDPKIRLISAAPYFDRVVHHALINVIGPIISRSFIYDTYACIKGKGTHKAIERYRQFQKKNKFVLKCDIKKYFFNVDHDILFEQLSRKIKCPDTLWLIKQIIDSSEMKSELEYFPGDDLFTPLSRKKGIPIGNLTSQFFSNLYLDGFDHFVKEKIKARHYIRYCDDFVVFDNSKERLCEIKKNIVEYLESLRLNLHANKSRVFRTADGVDFLGFRIYPSHMRVRKSNVRHHRKKLRGVIEKYETGKISRLELNSFIQGWIGHVKHANSFNLRKELLSPIVLSWKVA